MNKKKILTQEEIRENNLRRIQNDLRFCSSPTYFFNVGDSVSIGNLEDGIVFDILYNGKVYEIDYTSTDNNYGNPIRTEHCHNFWFWYEVRPLTNNSHNIIKNKDLELRYSQRQIESIIYATYKFGVNLDPEYQRGYIWSNQDEENLIESIFNNIDIGKFVFSHEDYSEYFLYEVIDGKQRINTLLRFYENKFSYNGLYFNDLSKKEQNHFCNYPVSYAEIYNATREQKLRYFVRLNNFGKVMDEKHLNKVKYLLDQEINQGNKK